MTIHESIGLNGTEKVSSFIGVRGALAQNVRFWAKHLKINIKTTTMTTAELYALVFPTEYA